MVGKTGNLERTFAALDSQQYDRGVRNTDGKSEV
jgi:hypothetical protein